MNRAPSLLHRESIAAVSVLGLAVAGLLGAVLGNLLQGRAAEALAADTTYLLMILLTAVIIVITMQVRVLTGVEQIRKRKVLSIDYYPGTTACELLELHRQAARVVREAPDDAEIYAVNSYVEVFAGPVAPAVQQAQRDYLREFEHKFRTTSYHRLIQLSNNELAHGNGRPLSHLIAPAYLEHYRKIAEYAHDHPQRPIKIEEVEARLPTSFVLIRKGNAGQIIWQMNQHAPGNGQPDALTINGVFIITDPDGAIVRSFMHWFQLLDRGHAYPLTKMDLRDPATAPSP
jgi:hypothetical protein